MSDVTQPGSETHTWLSSPLSKPSMCCPARWLGVRDTPPLGRRQDGGCVGWMLVGTNTAGGGMPMSLITNVVASCPWNGAISGQVGLQNPKSARKSGFPRTSEGLGPSCRVADLEKFSPFGSCVFPW